MTLLAFTWMCLWSLELLWKGRKEAQTFGIFTCRCLTHHLNSSFSFHPLVSLSWKNVTAFPWVQCFIQISRSILFSSEGKNFCLKLWVLVDSKCRFNFFSLYLFLFLLLPKCCFYAGGRVIACGTLRKLWLDALFEPLFELLKWIKWTAYLGKLVPVNFLTACFFDTTQYFKTQFFFPLQSDFHLWFRIYVFNKAWPVKDMFKMAIFVTRLPK